MCRISISALEKRISSALTDSAEPSPPSRSMFPPSDSPAADWRVAPFALSPRPLSQMVWTARTVDPSSRRSHTLCRLDSETVASPSLLCPWALSLVPPGAFSWLSRQRGVSFRAAVAWSWRAISRLAQRCHLWALFQPCLLSWAAGTERQ